MKVLLCNVAEYFPGHAASPPMGILSLAAWVRSKISGLDLRLLDQHIEKISYEELSARLIREQADVVCLSYMTRSAAFIPEITRALRAANPSSIILLGGPHPAAAEAEALRGTQADALCTGEGERSLELLLQSIRDGSDFNHIPGLVRWDQGEVVQNAGEPLQVDDLDELPFLAYDLIDLARYWKFPAMSIVPPPRRYAALSSSRGCPYRCIYCHDIFGKTFRAQSAERLVAEIEHLQRTYNLTHFDFFDDIFNLDRARVLSYSDLVTSKGLRFYMGMGNGVRTDLLTEDVVDAMVAAGLQSCAFALESGSKRIQKLIKKNLNIDKFLSGVELAARRRVFTYGFNILGFPTETAEEMELTIRTATDSWLHHAVFFKATPYPKTALWDIAQEMCPEKLADLNYMHHNFQSNHGINFSAVSDDQLMHYLRSGPRTFHMRPGRMWRAYRDWPEPYFLPRLMMQPVKRLMRVGGREAYRRPAFGHEVTS